MKQGGPSERSGGPFLLRCLPKPSAPPLPSLLRSPEIEHPDRLIQAAGPALAALPVWATGIPAAGQLIDGRGMKDRARTWDSAQDAGGMLRAQVMVGGYFGGMFQA